MFNIEH